MDAFFKTGAIFVTITPNDEGNLSIAAIAGRVCTKSMYCLENDCLPDRAIRKSIAGVDPLACSEYFENVCETFMEDVMGFSREKGLPYREGGIFGHIKAFLGVVEAQNSGTLHLHAILFVAGLPRTIQEFSSKCVDNKNGHNYKRSLCDFVDSVVQTSLPVSPIVDDAPFCPKCGEKGSMGGMEKISDRAFQKQEKRRSPEKTSTCLSCNSSCGGCEVLRSEMKRLHETLDVIAGVNERRIPLGDSHQETDDLTARYCVRPDIHLWPPENESGDSEVGRLHRLFLSRIGLLTQQHNYRHVDSCFKSSSAAKTGQCRYGFPRQVVPCTHIDDKLCLVLRRNLHNEYINSYNDVMLALFRTNHDLRFLLGGTTDALYYVMKYVTKSAKRNTAVESAIMAAYERRRRVEKNKHVEASCMTKLKKGRALINSMAIAISKMQEIPSPLCALYLRKKTAFYSSHGFANLLLGQAMAFVEKEEHETELVMRNDGRYVRATQYLDYVCRPKELDHLSLVELVSSYRRALLPRGTKPKDFARHDNTHGGSFSFQHGHPLEKSHCLVKQEVTVVPEIIGPRLPNCEKLETESAREKYGLIASVLFRPFRQRRDLRKGGVSYWDAFDEFLKSDKFSRMSKRILENMQEYYVSKQSAAMEREVLANAQASYTEEDAAAGDNVREALFQSDNEFSDIEDLRSYEQQEGMSSLSFALEGIEGKFKRETYAICSESGTHFSVQLCAKENKTSMERSSMNPWNTSSNLPEHIKLDKMDIQSSYRKLSDLSRLRVGKDFDENTFIEDGNAGCHHTEERQTIVERLRDILSGIESLGSSGGVDEMKDEHSTLGTTCVHYMTPQRVAEIFSLNALQRKAFLLAAQALLERMSEGFTDLREQGRRRQPFTMYLGGEGGTGKTRVIEALLFLTNSWGRPGAVQTCAPTGMAACLVQGKTVHALLGIRAGRSFNPKRRLSLKLKELHAGTLMLIIDEVSMLGRQTLGAIDAFLRQAKECNLPFGGVAVVLAGDFFQIAPVGSEAVYLDPRNAKRKGDILDKIGYQAWQQVDNVIILEESMRHTEDQKFGECLGRVRRGTATDDDLRLLNTRVVSNVHGRLPPFGGNIHLVVRTNELRMALNWEAIKACSESSGSKPIVCIAELQSASGKSIAVDDLEILMNLDDSQTSHLAVVLPLLPCMPVRISHNVAVDLGIANGAEGVLVGISFERDTLFQEAVLFGVRCDLCTRLPKAVFVKSEVFKKRLPTRFPILPSHYTDDTIPMTPIEREDVSLKARGQLRTKTKISIRQLPIVPCYSSTIYKVQGSTVAGVVAFPFVRGCRGAPPTAALYVVLSRVRRLSSLFLTEKITKEDMQHFIPSEALQREEERLQSLHRQTAMKRSCGG